MTKSHRSAYFSFVYLIPAILCFLLSGCIPSKTQTFATSFLPAAPNAEPESGLATPPPVMRPDYFSHEKPVLVQRTIDAALAPSDVDERIRRADGYFESGQRIYRAGDAAAARREFDHSIEVLMGAPENAPDHARLEHKLNQLVDQIYRYDLEGLGAGEQREEVVYDKPPFDGILEMTFPTDPTLSPKVKEEVRATASQLPLDANEAVLSYINYFSSERGKRTVVAGLKRSGRYRAMIQHILDEEGVPRELMYLAQIESGFLPRAQSYRAAVGMWQFVQFRGREYGLGQTPVSDDRLDPEKATRAAAHHLHDLYTQFGDWYLAMAAYNCGPGCVDRAVQRTGFADFWELRARNALPHETMNYVPAIVALTIVSKNLKDYSIENVELDPALEYDSVTLHAATNLALISDALGRPLSDIQDLNPALLKPITPAEYELRLPKGTAPTAMAALETIPETHRGNWRLHRVQTGESIADIARSYATPAESIVEANNSAAALPEAGDWLAIPVAYRAERTVSRSPIAASTRRHGRTRTVAARTVAARTMVAHSVPEKVLHHRASNRTVRTASASLSSLHATN